MAALSLVSDALNLTMTHEQSLIKMGFSRAEARVIMTEGLESDNPLLPEANEKTTKLYAQLATMGFSNDETDILVRAWVDRPSDLTDEQAVASLKPFDYDPTDPDQFIAGIKKRAAAKDYMFNGSYYRTQISFYDYFCCDLSFLSKVKRALMKTLADLEDAKQGHHEAMMTASRAHDQKMREFMQQTMQQYRDQEKVKMQLYMNGIDGIRQEIRRVKGDDF